MPRKLFDLGQDHSDMGMSAPAPGGKHYPCLYLRGDDIPDLPGAGEEFFVIARVRNAGQRDPSDGPASFDLEVKALAPISDKEARALVKMPEADEDEIEPPSKGMKKFRDTMADIAAKKSENGDDEY